MSEPVSLDSEQLLLLIKRAEATGYMKAIEALANQWSIGTNHSDVWAKWLESKKEEILK